MLENTIYSMKIYLGEVWISPKKISQVLYKHKQEQYLKTYTLLRSTPLNKIVLERSIHPI